MKTQKYLKLIIRFFAITLVGLVLSACTQSQAQSQVNREPLAKLTSYQFKGGHLYFTTISQGCTFVGNFKLTLADSNKNLLKVVQVKPDLCRMKTHSVTLQYSYKHLGLDKNKPVLLVNQV